MIDRNKTGDRIKGASRTTHVLQNTAMKFFSGVSKNRIDYTKCTKYKMLISTFKVTLTEIIKY